MKGKNWARGLARIKGTEPEKGGGVQASGAGDPGFKSRRARQKSSLLF